jgi:hypothetical protein
MANKDLHDPNDDEGDQTAEARAPAVARKARAGTGRGLDARSQEAIGRSLKAHYIDLVRAPVPDRFMELLDRLEAKEQYPKSEGGDNESKQL